ncbi:MAG: DoxX family protein [bacterium]
MRLFPYAGEKSMLLLRLGIGVVFIVHGAQKLFGLFGGGGISGTSDFFSQIGIPLPGLMAAVVAIVEFFGGLLLLLGFMTQIAALLISVVMIVAILKVKLGGGFIGGWEFDWMLLTAALTLALHGPGEASLESSREFVPHQPEHRPSA